MGLVLWLAAQSFYTTFKSNGTLMSTFNWPNNIFPKLANTVFRELEVKHPNVK